MVNRGEEKVRVHMNVVPRSTGNTNSGTRELTVNSLVPLFVFPVLRGTTFVCLLNGAALRVFNTLGEMYI